MNMSAASPAWGDLGDGTYRNPILPGDYCDPDVVRDGDLYYLITSSFQMCPGMPVLESRDLVNWRTIAHAIPDPAALDPDLGWERMAAYNTGIYAGSLRKLEWMEPDALGKLIPRKRWFVHTTLFTAGFIVSTADNIRGPWTTRFMEDRKGRPLRAMRWDDPCPFWELNPDGTLKQAWLVASKLPGAWYPHTFRLSTDGTRLLDGDLDCMNTEGDTSRRRENDKPAGRLLHRRTGQQIPETRSLDDGHLAAITAQGDLLSVLDAGHIPDREGTVTHDHFSAEAAKIFRFGTETEIGRSTFAGRHGPGQRVCDYLYLFHSEFWDGMRIPVMRRSKSIYGDRFGGGGRYLGPGGPANPGAFETQRLMVDLRHPVPTREPNQGGFVDVPASLSADGCEHWFWITHHGEKEVYPECRPTSLLPVTWINGWPFPGDPPPGDPHSSGAPDIKATPYAGSGLTPEAEANRHHPHQPLKPFIMRWLAPKPPVRGALSDRTRFQDSDNFGEGDFAGEQNSSAEEGLSPNWLWNHSPRPGFWSLAERPGWLRLHAFASADGSDTFFRIRNILSQSYIATPFVLAETRLDLAGMKPGQEAGIAHFDGGKHHACLGVFCEPDGARCLRHNLKQTANPVTVPGTLLRLRTEVGVDRVNLFRYSFDEGVTWHNWPARHALRSGGHRGDRIGLYTLNNLTSAGHADFDYFRYEYDILSQPARSP